MAKFRYTLNENDPFDVGPSVDITIVAEFNSFGLTVADYMTAIVPAMDGVLETMRDDLIEDHPALVLTRTELCTGDTNTVL